MKRLVIGLATTLALAGCTTFGGPPMDEIATRPVVRVGQPAPSGVDQVTFIPAGQPFPVTLSAHGSLFTAPVQAASTATLTRDLYL